MEHDDLTLIAPIRDTSRRFYVFIAAVSIVFLWGVYAWWNQFNLGLQMTGLNNTVVWGLYISNFVFFIGISHAGILISSTVRLLNLKVYRSIARMAEVLTLTGLVMGVLSVITDLGRPDRVLNLLLYLKVGSPLAWDLLFISLYFISSAFYLFISLKKDIIFFSSKHNFGGWLYKLLIGVYNVIPQKTSITTSACSTLSLY